MRPGQQNKRMRGRNRRGPSPLSRSYESNGPDVKIRGTASHIAEKYMQLARDAQSSGDPVAAENYFQHAEHYFRIIAAAQGAGQGAQQGQAQQQAPSEQPRQQRNGADEATPEAAEATVQPKLDTPQPSVDDVQPTIPAPAGTEEQPSIDLTTDRPKAAAEAGDAGSDVSVGNGSGTNGSQAPRRRRRRPAPAAGTETATAAAEAPAADTPAAETAAPEATVTEPAEVDAGPAAAEQTDPPPKRTRRPRLSKAANGAGEKDAGKATESGEDLFPATDG